MSKKVPKGWNIFLVKDAFDIGRGRVISKNEIRDKPGKYPVYSSQSTNNGKMGSINTYDFSGEYVTWTTDGAYAGTVFYRKGKFNCTNVCGTIKDNNSYPVNMKFIAEYLSTVAMNHVSYVGNPKLMNGVFGEIEILSPPLPEQKKIASILASVDEVIKNAQKQIDKLQNLKKATMNELLTKGIGHTEFKDSELGKIPKGWRIEALGDISKIYFSNVDKKNYTNEIPVFLCNYMDVYNNSCIKNGIEFMRATAKRREIDKFLLLKDDVIITKDSETPDDIAVSAYVSEDLKNVLCGYHLALIRSDKTKLSGAYLAHLFELDGIRHRYCQLANGSTRFGLTSDAVIESSVPVPPLSEQKKIAFILSSMDKNIEEKRVKLNKTQSLKKSLMQDLLAGKVRVKVN